MLSVKVYCALMFPVGEYKESFHVMPLLVIGIWELNLCNNFHIGIWTFVHWFIVIV